MHPLHFTMLDLIKVHIEARIMCKTTCKAQARKVFKQKLRKKSASLVLTTESHLKITWGQARCVGPAPAIIS
jgi:hypothetical protein